MEKQQTPTFSFSHGLWPGGDPLTYVNAEKFDRNELLRKLGWEGIHPGTVTNADSIRRRQDSLKLCMAAPLLGRFVRKTNVTSYPVYGKDFFTTYGSRSAFNRRTRGLINVLGAATSSPDFHPSTNMYQELIEQLTWETKRINSMEDSLVKKLEKQLGGVYSYSGVVKIQKGLKEHSSTKLEHDVYGFRDYSFYKENPWFVKYSKVILNFYKYWPENKFGYAGVLLLKAIPVMILLYVIASAAISFAEKSKNDALYTKVLPGSVRYEIERINDVFLANIRRSLRSRLAQMNVHSSDTAVESILINTEFQFSLKPESGFSIRLIDLDTETKVPKEYVYLMNENWDNPFSMTDSVFNKGISLYSIAKRKLFSARAKRLSNEAARKFLKLPLRYALEGALVESRDLLSKGDSLIHKDSYLSMMNELKYSSVKDAIEGLTLQSEFDEIINFRHEVVHTISVLDSIAHKAVAIQETRKKFKDFPFCFPTILEDDKNIVSFGKLAPLHLLGRQNKDHSKNLEQSDLRLITGLPALNGQILSITGQNGGGKTVVETELIHTLTIAHMGFPVFADHFTMNAKDVIAMVFVEKGEGSMLQLLMEKMKIVAEVVDQNQNNKVVVILDELLTGTQEKDGFKIGCQYLNMLSKKKCSTLFVTQITELAEYAQEHLNALSFHFKEDGTMKEGIGVGNAMYLADEVGLTPFLEDKI